jgi:hypothetical protein
VAAADQRQRRRHARQRGEPVEEIILRTEHDRRPEDHRLRHGVEHGRLAQRLGLCIARARILVGADRRDVDHWRPERRRRLGDQAGAVGVHGGKPLAPALEQDSDKIDDHVAAVGGVLHRFGVAQVGLNRMDLAHAAERLQVSGQIGAAHPDPDAIAALGERAHQMAAEETGTAEDGDEGLFVEHVRANGSGIGKTGFGPPLYRSRRQRTKHGGTL